MKCMIYSDAFIVQYAVFENKMFRKSDDVLFLCFTELCTPEKNKHISHIPENHSESHKQSLDLQDELKKVPTWSSTSMFGYEVKFQKPFNTERKKEENKDKDIHN